MYELLGRLLEEELEERLLLYELLGRLLEEELEELLLGRL